MNHVTGKEDSYLVVASDGIWDALTNDEVGKIVLRKYRLGSNNCVNPLIEKKAINLAGILCRRAK